MIGLLMLATAAVAAPQTPATEYTTPDSIEVVRLMGAADKRTTLDFARTFVGRPYVAHTLDGSYADGGNGEEHLVVNLQGFDCLTLVETCSALALAKAGLRTALPQVADAWTNYCSWLTQLRYFGGRIDGYGSRLHYLTMNIAERLQRGDFEEVHLPDQLTVSRTAQLGFMSQHPQYYDALKADATLTQELAELERRYSGTAFRYLPQENCGLSRQKLSAIHDGDIIYIVTSKPGLDYAHQGFAYWGSDGKLHMLHASSAKKHVMEDPLPLDAYLKGIKTSIGIRVFRLKSLD